MQAMVVRIRFGRGSRVGQRRKKNQRAAVALAALLTPAAVMALALGIWSVAAGLQWTQSFAIPSGLFSHWQVWMGVAVVLQLCSRVLNRYARAKDAPAL